MKMLIQCFLYAMYRIMHLRLSNLQVYLFQYDVTVCYPFCFVLYCRLLNIFYASHVVFCRFGYNVCNVSTQWLYLCNKALNKNLEHYHGLFGLEQILGKQSFLHHEELLLFVEQKHGYTIDVSIIANIITNLGQPLSNKSEFSEKMCLKVSCFRTLVIHTALEHVLSFS